MTSGKNDFKTRINRLAVAEITRVAEEQGISFAKGNSDFLTAAPFGDIKTAQVLFALETYLMERRCEPDFELVLSE